MHKRQLKLFFSLIHAPEHVKFIKTITKQNKCFKRSDCRMETINNSPFLRCV